MREYVANRVHELRSESEMTQEALAEKVGVSRQTVIAIERGNYAPSVLLAMKIARAFRLPVESVFSLRHAK